MLTLYSGLKWLKKKARGTSWNSKVKKIAFACTVYYVWLTRNMFIFDLYKVFFLKLYARSIHKYTRLCSPCIPMFRSSLWLVLMVWFSVYMYENLFWSMIIFLHSIKKGFIKPALEVSIEHNVSPISHLIFADDTILFFWAIKSVVFLACLDP